MATQLAGIDGLKQAAGTHIGTGEWMAITQESINAFAEATGDRNWVHIDPVRAAAEGPAGRTIYHGYGTLSMIPVLFTDLLEVTGIGLRLNYGLNRVRFPAPVPVDSRIRLDATLRAVDEFDGGAQLLFDFTIQIEGNAKPACVAEALFRYYAAQ